MAAERESVERTIQGQRLLVRDLECTERGPLPWLIRAIAEATVCQSRMAKRIRKHRRIITRLLALRRRHKAQLTTALARADAADQAGYERGVREAAEVVQCAGPHDANSDIERDILALLPPPAEKDQAK